MAKPQKSRRRSVKRRPFSPADHEDTFRGLVEGVPDSILIHRANKIVYVSPSCMKLLSAKSPSQLLGRDISEIVHPDYRTMVGRRNQALLATGKRSPPSESVIVGLTGEPIEVESSAIPVRWKGSPAIAVLIHDILERRKAQFEMRAWHKRLELAQKAGLRIGFWDWDIPSGRLVWSEEVYRQFGYTHADFGGTAEDFRRRLHPEDRERVEEAIQKVVAGGSEYDIQFRVVRPDGSIAWLDSHGVLIGNARMIGISADITEMKNLEQQFLEAQKLEAVGRLAGGVAHDFNNVLMSISSYAEMLVNGRLDPKRTVQYATRIYEAAMQAASVTRQLLAFSHKQKLEPEFVNLDQVISDLATMMPTMLGEDIVLNIQLETPLGLVKLDRGQIEQVIMNLAVNARDAMPRGGNLSITTAAVDLDEPHAAEHASPVLRRYARLSMTDTGTGMDDATKSQIFEPFFTTKERGKGTGLGLATVYGIVKQSGGFIRVHSELGKGSRFDIYFPLSTEVQAAAPTRKPERSYPIAQNSETILLVEDDIGLRDVLKEFLLSVGYRVLVASSSTEALRQCEAHARDIDLMITDVVMPGLDGVELARGIRVIHPRIRILLMSGYNNKQFEDLGQDMVLIKPFRLFELAAKIRDLLDHTDVQPGGDRAAG
jgi:two-component system, cell cycle sensor histidine kinase and response regulator CckA